MHELGLCDAIVEAAVRRAGGRRVAGVRVRFTGHPVDPAVIDQGVRLAAAGTAVEGASVELVACPPSVRCRDCGHRVEATDGPSLLACARCGGIDVEVADAEELVLESLVFAAAEDGRT